MISTKTISDFVISKLKNNADGSWSGNFVDKRTGNEYLIYSGGKLTRQDISMTSGCDTWFIYEATKDDINLICGDVTFRHIVNIVTDIANAEVSR